MIKLVQVGHIFSKLISCFYEASIKSFSMWFTYRAKEIKRKRMVESNQTKNNPKHSKSYQDTSHIRIGYTSNIAIIHNWNNVNIYR